MRCSFFALALTLAVTPFGSSSAQTPALCKAFIKDLPREAIEARMSRSDGSSVYNGKHITYYAAVLGSSEKLRRWVSDKETLQSVDASTLTDSVAAGELESVRILVEAGVSPDLRAERDATPLIVAVGCGRTEILNYLIDTGANVNARNADGIDPMIHAIMEGNVTAVSILLDRGFNLQRSETKNGLRPIDIAKRRTDKEILGLLRHAMEK